MDGDDAERGTIRQPLDLTAVRAGFPGLRARAGSAVPAFLDNAAGALQHGAALDAMARFDEAGGGNVHRGVHGRAVAATADYEAARETVRRFLGAATADEVVFTRGATEGLNLVARAFAPLCVGPGDEVVASVLEHHANLVPWQLLCRAAGARLVPLPLDRGRRLDPARLEAVLSTRTRVVALAHASNVVGTVVDVAQVARRAHAVGAVVVVDGAQAVAHLPVDVGALGCDFYAFSAHKAYGPTGAGVLWGRRELLERMPPWQAGGGMVTEVGFAHSGFRAPPHRFEAGTPPIAAVLGMAAALDWLSSLGWERVAAHEEALARRAAEGAAAIEGVRVLRAEGATVPIVALALARAHPHDIATLLDGDGVQVGAGTHCAQPLHEHLGVRATLRASLAVYTTEAEVDAFAQALAAALRFLAAR